MAHTNNSLIYCGVIEPFISSVHVRLFWQMRWEESQNVEGSGEKRTALFWVVTQLVVVISGTFRMGPTGLCENVSGVKV